jgi:replicative DNA helicase
MSILRQLPQSIEAEETLLGMIIQDNNVLEESKKYITTPDMFYSNVNKRTYEIMLNLEKKSSSINPVTIMAALTDNDKKVYEGLNGYFLTGLVELSDLSYKVNDYSRIIAEKYLKRRLIKSTQLIEKTAYKNDKAFNDLVEDVSKISHEFQSVSMGQEFELDTLIKETETSIYESVNLIKYGFDSLNKLAGGMTRGEITVIGGRPGHGKTTLVVNLCYNLLKQGLKVMMINREMSNKEMMKKLLVLSSKELSYSAIRQGGRNMSEKTMNQLAKAMQDMKQYKDQLFMFDKLFTLEDSHAVINRYKPDIILDDYIQLVRVNSKNDGRRFEIEEIMRSYKEVAKKHNCIPILVSQLNRNIEGRIDKVPKMSDLSEGGSIEQVAENIIFVYYDYKDNYENSEYGPDRNQLVAAKVRYGTGGRITMGFDGNRCLFHENITVRTMPDKSIQVDVPETFSDKNIGKEILSVLND